jgi:hypothetical protein
MTIRRVAVTAIMLAAGLGLVGAGSTSAHASAAAMVVLMAWALVSLLKWRSDLRLRIASPAVGPAHHRKPEARPH